MLCGPSLFPRGTVFLFAQNFFDLSDFFLDFPAYLFGLAFGFEVGIIRQLPRFFLHFSFQVMKLAFLIYFALATGMATFALNVRNLFHCFALHAAILSGHCRA
jgi:hypothetical protein